MSNIVSRLKIQEYSKSMIIKKSSLIYAAFIFVTNYSGTHKTVKKEDDYWIQFCFLIKFINFSVYM